MKSTISREAKLQKLREEFRRMDTNGDNYIEAQELVYHLDMKNVG
jgi:Ca2+-binding EF-hand superfamily protein